MPFLCEYVDQCKQSPPPPPTPKETNMPIGCIIMYHTNSGFTPDNGGTNGYFLNFGAECWKLCDGTTGSTPATGSAFGATPNLINKFARGIDTSAPPQLLTESININVDPITLTSDQLPAHTHQQGSVQVSGITDAPAPGDCDHDHNNCDGTWGFNYWIPNIASGTEGGNSSLSSPKCNSLFSSPCPAYSDSGGSSGGNKTGGVSGSGNSLASHMHKFTVTIPATTTGSTGSGKPFTPTANGSSIKPASQDVLFIIRVV